MNLQLFRDHSKKDGILFTVKSSADELAFEIDDGSIFDNCTSGEYFNYEGVKVFVVLENYNTYKKLLLNRVRYGSDG